jgi:integrase
MKLTLRKIEGLTCAAGRKDALYFDDEQRGLAVRVAASAGERSLEGKNFLAQYTVDGKKRRVPLGGCKAISLDAARKATAALLGEVAQGRDPAAARKEAAREAKRKTDQQALTLSALIDQWEGVRLVEKRESYASEAVRALRFAFDGHLKHPAADLSRRLVVRVLDELTKAGKAAMAARTAAYGRACYAWAIKRGSLAENPFTSLPLAPVEKRDRVLTDAELRAIWKATGEAGSFNAIVRALILTGQRREEVAQMAWGEIAVDCSVWTLPGERTKNGVAHIVPLSPQMQAHLDAFEAKRKEAEAENVREPPEGLVFPGRDGPFNGFGKAKAALDKASGVKNWRLHDLRRTLATGLQKLGVRLEVTEAVLNHVSGSRAGIVGIYQRHDYADEKRAALNAWGAHVAAVAEGKSAPSNVTPLRAREA